MSTTGSGGGSSYKLVYIAKIVSGECLPGNDGWTIPGGSTITIHNGGQAFSSSSTMVLPNANDVTFTNSTFTGFTGNLVVSSSTTYSPVGTWNGLVWTPPSAGTYYAGYEQDWYDAGLGDCTGGTVYGPGTASFTWSQP